MLMLFRRSATPHRPALGWAAALLAIVLLASVGSSAGNASEQVCASGASSNEDGSTCAATDDDRAGSSGGVIDDEDPPVCADNHDDCGMWTDMGECVANPGFMLSECKKSCKVCGDVEEDDLDQPCEDELDDGCAAILEKGECGMFLAVCRKTCGTCAGSTADFGPEQRVADNENAARTRVIIRESIKYMRDIRQNPEHKNIKQCENTHEDCSFWAAIGECNKNTGYMNTNCAPACQTCYLIDFKTRCPIDPDAVDAIYPGDMNKMFERITGEDSEYAEYNPTVLSRPLREGETEPVGYKEGPWAVTFDNFVTDEEIERLLYHGNNTGYERSGDVGKAKIDGTHDSLYSKSRTSENAWCGDDCKSDPIVDKLINRIAALTDTPRENSEDLQLLRYEPGQYYIEHHDYIPHQLERPCGVRIYTLFLYLNDVDEGGETAFPRLGLSVSPKKGKALLWPSVLDEAPNEKDERTQHKAAAVEKGIKYGANAWIHMRDFQGALESGCI